MSSSSIDKIQISGPTLASLLHRLTTSSGDIDGLLFGHVITTTPPTLSDTTTTTTPPTTTTITITSFFSSPSSSTFYTPSGHLLKPTLTSLTTNQPPLIGWFSGRRKTHLRPSMKESNVTSNLAKYIQNHQPCIFLLLTTPFYDNLIHTHDYKVFSFTTGSHVFEVKGLDVVNLGPGFRGHYGHFEPMSLFPHLGFSVKGLDIESMVEDGGEAEGDGIQKFRDLCDGSGFDIGRLKRLLGEQASGYTAELEEMYSNMIKKMNDLAKLVEQSSAKVLQQENHNMKLRYKVAGLE